MIVDLTIKLPTDEQFVCMYKLLMCLDSAASLLPDSPGGPLPALPPPPVTHAKQRGCKSTVLTGVR